ncbi:MAG: hypothetical protein ABW019_02885 [Chitinophagaceae bacterium]
MRSYLFILILCAGFATASAQQAFPGLDKQVVIAATTMRFDSLLQRVSRQSGIKFSVNTRKIPASRNIHLAKKTYTVRDLLSVLTVQTKIYYTTIGAHIILVEKPPAAGKMQGPPAMAKNFRPVSPKPFQADTYSRLPDSLEPALPPRKEVKIQAGSFRPELPVLSLPVVPVVLSSTPDSITADKKTRRYIPFVTAGAGVDDIFYANLTIRGGLPFLYGIASLGTDFNHSGIRYGAGTSVRLNAAVNIHLRLLAGSCKALFYDSASGKRIFRVKGQLKQLQLVAEKKITNRLSWEAGVNFTILKTSYYQSGVPFATGMSKKDVEARFPFIHPFYTLTDNYNPARPAFTCSWIGLQAGLIFKWP